MDNTFAHFPFPAYYLVIVIFLFIILKWCITFFKEKPKPITEKLFSVLSFAGFVITFFFITWGFNYGRIPLETKLNLQPDTITLQQLEDETKLTIKNLNDIRNTIKSDTNNLPQILFINNIETNCRTALNNTLQNFKYKYSNKIRGRFLLDDMLLAFGIGGQYMPFIGEANVDNAVYYSKKPFFLIHELAHGNGFTQEAECNFLAYVSCVQSSNLSLQYSGELNYLFYLFSELKYRNETAFESIFKNMPSVIIKDITTIQKYMEQHSYKSDFLGAVINNVYLKILGVPDGVKNYDKMVLLVYKWKQKNILQD